MKTKILILFLSIAVVLQLGVLAGSTQTNIYLFSGSETNITLPPGAYIIIAYGAPGGFGLGEKEDYVGGAGAGAEMSAELKFSASTTLILLASSAAVVVAGSFQILSQW